MTVQEFISKSDLKIVNKGNNLSNSISQPFCCDLLSICMSKLPPNAAWVTVMGNINTLAVATLTDTACIILAEGVTLDDTAKVKAQAENITVLKTDSPIFETALMIQNLLHENA
jgi:serine kinase of HPr protein (carbohydrate metabolism regulator)